MCLNLILSMHTCVLIVLTTLNDSDWEYFAHAHSFVVNRGLIHSCVPFVFNSNEYLYSSLSHSNSPPFKHQHVQWNSSLKISVKIQPKCCLRLLSTYSVVVWKNSFHHFPPCRFRSTLHWLLFCQCLHPVMYICWLHSHHWQGTALSSVTFLSVLLWTGVHRPLYVLLECSEQICFDCVGSVVFSHLCSSYLYPPLFHFFFFFFSVCRYLTPTGFHVLVLFDVLVAVVGKG